MTDNRGIAICNQNIWRRFFWAGGVYYVDFTYDKSDIMKWLFENIKTRNVKIKRDLYSEGSYKYSKLKDTTYKIHFKKKTDFIAFKLVWL